MKDCKKIKVEMRENGRERTGERCIAGVQAIEFSKVMKVELQLWFLSSWKQIGRASCRERVCLYV